MMNPADLHIPGKRRKFIMDWLKTRNERKLKNLWRMADQTREAVVGKDIHLRGLIEISNLCNRQCFYCGIRKVNKSVERYSMRQDEILEAARLAESLDYGTVVLQAGESGYVSRDFITEVISVIKSETGLAVTLSLGEHPEAVLEEWKTAGADRYYMRFETSNNYLFWKLHPDRNDGLNARLKQLRTLDQLGYETGSGVMVGLPGQTLEDLCNDLLLFGSLNLDMIGIGPFIKHPGTPIGQNPDYFGKTLCSSRAELELLTGKMIALTRLLYPAVNIPATTALATINSSSGFKIALQCGANVIMPNLTPPNYRRKYEIYPGKGCSELTAGEQHAIISDDIQNCGRLIARGAGPSQHFIDEHHQPILEFA